MSRLAVPGCAAIALALVGCREKPLTATVQVEVVQVQRFGDAKAPTLMDVEVRFACPGDARRVMRLDKAFAECVGNLQPGDKLEAEVVSTWSSERGSYRSDVTRLGSCPIKMDPKEEANYEIVQVCSDLKATGVTVGVTCERQRTPEQLAACPFLRRK